MEEKNDEKKPKKTIKGLFFLIGSMDHHYANGIRIIARVSDPHSETGRKYLEELLARTHGLETDLNSIRGALSGIVTLAKKDDYEGIIKIIEKDDYQDGFENRRNL